MSDQSPKLLTSAELSERWNGFPVRTLDNWAWRGIGPTYLRLGRHRRYRLIDIEAYEQSQTRGGEHVTA